MADKPSRALVIYGDGQASLLSPSHAHLHSFASRAACGFLSLRTAPPPPDETESDRMVREFSQLLDVYDFYVARNEKHDAADSNVSLKEFQVPTISERFMGLKAAIVTNSISVSSLARNVGCSILQLDQLIKKSDPSDALLKDIPNDLAIVHKLLGLLGFSQGNVLEKSEFDLVLLHIRANEKLEDDKKKMVINVDIDWLNKLLGEVMETAQSEPNVASRLHTSVILSYSTVSASEEGFSLTFNSLVETNSDLSLLRPRQSYTMKGGNALNDIRHDHPMLLAQWQEGATRRDMARSFSFKEFKENGGNLAILADRFLHEVAFKLWKAPKYGA